MSKIYLQEKLESGLNIKTVNGQSLLGGGDLPLMSTEVPFLLDGTLETYKRVMKAWFLAMGVNAMTPAGITGLVDEWYEVTRDNWSGSVEFYQPSQSSVSTGAKRGDNAGLVCVPSTNSEKGTDDYEGLPLFAVVDCNFEYDSVNKRPVITAIEDVCGHFERNVPGKLVGVLQMSGYHFYDERETVYVHGVCANYEDNHDYCEPYPEAVEQDGSVRSWVVHAKYMSHTVDGKMTSYSGVIPTAWMSQNKLVDFVSAMDNGLCGGTIMDYAFLQLMFFIKYGQMTADGLLQGCLSYNYQYCVAAGETDVKRVLLTSAQAANIIEGSSLIIGTYNGSSKDRNTAANYNISGQQGCIVLSKETVTVGGASYVALNLDLSDNITTVGDGTEASGNTIVSTWHWKSGTCDNVLGNDGSPATPNNGKYPAKLQGIEYSVGGYEVMSDVILSEDTTNYMVKIVNDVSKQHKSSVSNYDDLGFESPKPASAAWEYIRKLSFKKGVFFAEDTQGASSSTYTRDAFYKDAAASTGTREWLAFGYLSYGTGSFGLSSLDGSDALSIATWYFLARLSCNGNRGEWTA